MPTCGFDRAWIGKCEVEVEKEGQRCKDHQHQVCHSCDAPATRECSETMGPLVCGFPLCDDCEHTIHVNGCSSCHSGQDDSLPEYEQRLHRKKGTQIFKAWYAEGANEYNAQKLQELIANTQEQEGKG